MNKQCIKFIATLALIGSSTVGAYAAEKATATTYLNMRQGKSTNSKIVKVIPKGEKVTVLDSNGSWFKVEYKGKEGYSYKKYLKQNNQDNSEVIQSNLKVSVNKGSSLNVRSGPSTNYKIIGKAKNGHILKATEKTGDWYKIIYDGKTGYVQENFIKVSNSQNESSTEQNVVVAEGPAEVTANKLNVRTGPGVNNPVICQVEKGNIIGIVAKETNTGWFKIQFKDGTNGWISGGYIKLPSQEYIDSNDPNVK
ncbi:SH3 domain-containing protein [Paraclostridium bifermentans]|uniref:SH3 domain-containing protein n=1 Tax=Paraclostridium bifermentans TaxID=1490 RepID=UPI0024B87959|nr:SH3 domain-containing protein [Paraclostridium bifermentans]